MFGKLVFVGKKVSKAFLFAAVLAYAVEFKDVPRDEEPFFLGFPRVGFLHGTDIDAFRLAAFRTDEVVMVMTWLDDLVDVSRCAVDFVNNAEIREEREVAIDRIEGNIGMLLAHGGKKLLRRGEGIAFMEGVEDGAPLRGQFVAFGAQEFQMIFSHDILLLSRVYTVFLIIP